MKIWSSIPVLAIWHVRIFIITVLVVFVFVIMVGIMIGIMVVIFFVHDFSDIVLIIPTFELFENAPGKFSGFSYAKEFSNVTNKVFVDTVAKFNVKHVFNAHDSFIEFLANLVSHVIKITKLPNV